MTKTRQRRLFDERPPGEESTGVEARVVFDRPLRGIFSYAVPSNLIESVAAGKRVLAPFGKGNRRTTGHCVEVVRQAPALAPESTRPLKEIVAVLDDAELVSPTMLALTRWIADRYWCGWGQAIETALPRAVKAASGLRWAVLLEPRAEEARPAEPLAGKQRRAFEALIELGRPATVKEVGQAARCGPDCVKALIAKGWVTAERRRMAMRPPRVTPVVWDTPPELNQEQCQALERARRAIDAGESRVLLLHGVTGSGKTEVYLRAIADVVARGKEAIVLVPEISLTPQTIERFRKRFDAVAVLHSHLSDVERNWHWKRIGAGEVQVVVGARSAIFAPCRRLGLIVIDEEHETTFKQDNTPRYHAREVAIERSRLERFPVILGSATPSLESYAAAQAGRFELVSLTRRVADLPMPPVDLVDLRAESKPGRAPAALSQPLALAIERTVAAGGQVILLLNRRGFSRTLLCPMCGFIAKCADCEIALTFHKELDRLLCHGCDAESPPPKACPNCRQPAIRFSGFGTERLEEEILRRFPGLCCARMDSDTMRSATDYERVLDGFRRGEIPILLGTQMIAKGLDYPNVRLVGVISADTARNLPDFRASERTFQLIAQVAGRTGRGRETGRVLVQTFHPEDPALLAAARHDFLRFAADELPLREQFGYPPGRALVRVIVRSTTEGTARAAAALLGDRLRAELTTLAGARVLGPAPAPIGRLKGFHRFHLLLHLPLGWDATAMLDRVLGEFQPPGDAEFAVDVDPVSMA